MLDAALSTIRAMIHPNGKTYSNTEDSVYKNWFHIKEFPVSQKICGIVATCLTMLLPLHTLNTVNPEKDYLLKVAANGLKSLISMLRDWTWPMKSTINSGEIRKA